MANLSIEPNELVTFNVRYEDDDVAVVEKPAHLVTQPGKGHEKDSLLNGLFAKYGARLQNVGKDRDFGLLHRLDRETSGLVLVALRPRAYDRLREAFEKREVKKFYWALVEVAPKRVSGVINRPIAEYMGAKGKDPRTKKLARISSAGKPAVTAYRILEANERGALLECRAVTGRLHQIRVHLASIGAPVVGDGFYGPGAASNQRLGLHSHRIAFKHPTTGESVDVRTPWPKELKGVLKRMGLKRPDLDQADPG